MNEDATTASNASGPTAISIEQLNALARAIEQVPPPDRFDLWPHDVGGSLVFELKECPELSGLPPLRPGRRALIVPRIYLDMVASGLRAVGFDVEVQPRGEASP